MAGAGVTVTGVANPATTCASSRDGAQVYATGPCSCLDGRPMPAASMKTQKRPALAGRFFVRAERFVALHQRHLMTRTKLIGLTPRPSLLLGL